MLLVLALAFGLIAAPGARADGPAVGRFLDDVEPGAVVPGADRFGPLREDLPIAPALRGEERLGWVFLNSDFAASTGYSGKPIHVLVGMDDDARVTGAQMVKHYEPIVLVGIPEARINESIERYAGLDVALEAESGGTGHALDIISGATVTVMVIDDSIVRSALKVARALGLGGLEAPAQDDGPARSVVTEVGLPRDWLDLVGDGSVRRLTLDVGMVNQAFADSGDPAAANRPEPGAAEAAFIDLYAALASVPGIGRSLLGANEWRNLEAALEPGEHAILVAARGRYSFKGSGYVRGGIFDRIQLIQGDASVRFRDRDHRRLGGLAAAGAPSLSETDLFVIPAEAGFDPTQPWRLQLLVQRATGATAKAFLTYDLSYDLPERYVEVEAPPSPPVEASAAGAASSVGDDESGLARQELWQRVWRGQTPAVVGLGALLATLTAVFFFQNLLVRRPQVLFWFRIGFLTIVLFWLGWWSNAQLSVVNVMTFANALLSGFSWDFFLMDPLVFILWCAVAAALIFWGRGAYCGWLCPFGALQELTNRLAKLTRVPQWQVPFGLHERLWPIKYVLFLGLLGLSVYSLALAERLAEVEPFKTAIILNFVRDWPFVVYAALLLVVGLFVERFYCRYLCPLGAALAIPGRLRTFDWLRRYRECGQPCQRCANECMVQAIHPEGHINPNECLQCLHCQTLYQDDQRCPVCIQKRLKRERRAAVLTSRKPVVARAVLGPKAEAQPAE